VTRGLRIRVKLNEHERTELERLTSRFSTPQGLAMRAKIILQAADRHPNKEIASALGVHPTCITRWTQRWECAQESEEPILSRLLDMPRSGRPSHIEPEQLCRLVALACEDPEAYGRPITHWTREELTEEAIKQGIFSSISSRHIGRLLKSLELKPHKNQYWLNAKADPKKDEKIAAICEVYNEASDKKKDGIITISVDEMTGVQALERTVENIPMKQGSVEKVEYEYIRHGTQCLFGGFDVATGEVFGECRQHRKEVDFLDFIQLLENHHSGYKQLRIVADNLNTHQSASLVEYVAKVSDYDGDLGVKGKTGILKSQKSRVDFLSNRDHKITFFYTPKHASWMNQIEIWFGIIGRKVVKRGNFDSVECLKKKLLRFIDYFNETMAHPYNWTYSGGVLKE
jgi:transposase